MGPQSQCAWHRQLKARFRSYWWLKTVGITVYIGLFMIGYFALLNHPQFPVRVMPLQPLDHWIGFQPWAVVPYASLWFYVGMAPSLLWLRGEMARYVIAATLLCLIGCSVFFLWPTKVPAFAVDWARWPAVNLLKSADNAGNACPSLHVAFAVLTAIWLHWLLRRVGAPRWPHAINAAWCMLIIWSTMATRQHVALDVEIGALLGGAVALGFLYLRPALVDARERNVEKREPEQA